MQALTRQGRWAFFLLVFVGSGLRLYGLTYHSLWLDETVSVYLASFPFGEIVRQGMSLQEPNPPIYHLLLHLWMRAFGSGEAGVRLLSSLAGTLYLPAVYLLGRHLLSARGALVATLLAAINPFLVWYSQEARMYALVAALSVWSLYCFVRALDSRRWFWWSAYVVVTVSSLYTHLYAAFLLPAQLLYLLFCARRHRASLGLASLAWAASVLCFAPWLWRAWELSASTPSWRPSLGLAAMLVACLEAFAVRRVPLTGVVRGGALVVSGGIALVGLASPQRSQEQPTGGETVRSDAFLALSLLVPFICAYALSFRQQIFTVYYLIVIVAPFLLALASGVDRLASLSRAAGLLPLVVVAGLFSYGLRHNWTLEYRKEEWRAAASYVAAHSGPGDAVVCHPEYVRIPFAYYYGGDLPTFAPFGGQVMRETDVAQALKGLRDYDTVWLVQSHTEWVDPHRAVEGWLSQSYPVVTEQYPPGVELKGYAATYRLEELPGAAVPVGAAYDGQVRLLGYQTDDVTYSATDDTYHPPSGWIHVTLYWEAVAEVPDDYVAVVRLVDDSRRVWGGSLERTSSALRFYPPSSWSAGGIVRDDHDVNLNPNTPQGTYALEVSLLTPSGQPLEAVHDGVQMDAVSLGRVSIAGS